MIDFVVTDTAGSGSGQCGGAAGEGGGGGQSAQSTISRYACRIMCERSAPYTARIYAAGFDSSKNIFLGVSVLPPTPAGARVNPNRRATMATVLRAAPETRLFHPWGEGGGDRGCKDGCRVHVTWPEEEWRRKE